MRGFLPNLLRNCHKNPKFPTILSLLCICTFRVELYNFYIKSSYVRVIFGDFFPRTEGVEF